MSTPTRDAVTDTLPALFQAAFPGYAEDATLDLPPLTPLVEQQIQELLTSRGFDAWSEALARVGNCSHPVRLHGHSETVDRGTGEILSSYVSSREPLGVTHLRCGNRRASECPSCSRLYAGDMFQLIRAGVAGGKTVAEAVAENPLVFATVTAPSFGPCMVVGTAAAVVDPPPAGRRIACTVGRAPARPGTPRTTPLLGQPLCPDCYDDASHVVWQWWAPDLWRRFTIAATPGRQGPRDTRDP